MPGPDAIADSPIEVRQSPQHGRGVFARRPIPAGALILEFRGPVLVRAEVVPDSYHLQIGEDRYLGASGAADDYVNHSCAPNSGFLEHLNLSALRDIAPGEEITWDYSTAIDEEDFGGFPCHCGAAGCRGTVHSFRRLDRGTQDRLRPLLLPYLRQKYFGDTP